MIFITYPRTGVNFITSLIEQQTGIKIPWQHDIYTSNKQIINIVRDPAESITSWITMQYAINDRILLNSGPSKVINLFSIPKYIKMYEFLLSQDIIFINYKDYKNIDDTLLRLYDKLDIQKINDNIDYDKIYRDNSNKEGYIPTSKQHEKYQEVVEIINNTNMSRCYELYSLALKKCI